jgi:hypothetical protein
VPQCQSAKAKPMKNTVAACVVAASMALSAWGIAVADFETTADISPYCTSYGAKLDHLRAGRDGPSSGTQEINGVPHACVTTDGILRLDYPVSPRASMVDADVM